ncbi:MAG: tetratricopeptide repeat protein [Woeseia sp.]
MNEPEPKTTIFKELARRRVFRSAVVYAGVAWLLVQVGDTLLPAFGAPLWVLRALTILLIVAFPPAMLLAWTVDISREGLVRTPDSRFSRLQGSWPKVVMVLVATAMSAGVLWWAWDDYIVRPAATRPAIKSQPVIAVNAPRKIIGKAENDWLGDGVANMIRSELAESQHVILVSNSRWRSLAQDVANAEELNAIAKRNGIDYLIDGEYVETPNGIVLTTHIDDVENGIEIHSSRIDQKDVAGILGMVPSLSIQIKQALRIPHREHVGLFEADFAIDNVQAYESYIAGLAYLIDFEYQAAESAFSTALGIAPDYYIARYRLAQVYEATGRSNIALATLSEIPEDANLSERLRLYVAGAKAYFTAERDPQKAIEIYRQLVAQYPYEMEAGVLLAEAYWLDFQDSAAIDEFRRLSKIHAQDPTAWMQLGERLLEIGELDEAKAALTRYSSMEPNGAYAYALLGNLALLQGDLSSAIEQYELALAQKSGFVVATIGLARSRYLQGDVAAAQALWQSVVDGSEFAADFRIEAAFDLAGVLRGRGLYAESLEPLQKSMPLIEEEGLRQPMALSQMGSTQLELGNVERARALIDESLSQAASPATRYLFASGMLELRRERFDSVALIVAELRSLAQQASDADSHTEDKAANYLEGLAALRQGNLQAAENLLRAAVDEPGYQYAIYQSGLALLYRESGDLARAAELAAAASTDRDAGDLRLDLELDRARAQLLHAEILAENGASQLAREQAERFIERWQGAAPDLPEVVRASALLAAR